VVISIESLPTRSRFVGANERVNACGLGCKTVTLRTVPYQNGLRGIHCRSSHEHLQASRVRLEYADVPVAGADYEVRAKPERFQLFHRGIVRKYSDFLAMLAQPVKKFRQFWVSVMDKMAQRSLLQPLMSRRAHSFLAGTDKCGGSRIELSLEVFMKRVAQPFPDSTICTQYRDEIDVTIPNRVTEHFSQHSETQPSLIIQRAIDIEHDQSNLVPVQSAVDGVRTHCGKNKKERIEADAITRLPRNSESGFCAEGTGLVENAG
jgi:hypothetical protein